MTRLHDELQRLYLPQAARRPGPDASADPSPLITAQGQVRAMVLGLAPWAAVSAVWSAVQTDLTLPAPAIAVAGGAGYQLWFSLAQPLPAEQAWAFLDALRLRYLGHIPAAQVALRPLRGDMPPHPLQHAALVPAALADGGKWSAFVAADLAPMFEDEPWLDLPPSPDGQASLLARLRSIAPAALAQALDRLRPPGVVVDAATRGAVRAAVQAQPALQVHDAPAAAAGPADTGQTDTGQTDTGQADSGPAGTGPAPAGTGLSPQDFLRGVMNNPGVALALRIEAAKALLPYTNHPGRL